MFVTYLLKRRDPKKSNTFTNLQVVRINERGRVWFLWVIMFSLVAKFNYHKYRALLRSEIFGIYHVGLCHKNNGIIVCLISHRALVVMKTITKVICFSPKIIRKLHLESQLHVVTFRQHLGGHLCTWLPNKKRLKSWRDRDRQVEAKATSKSMTQASTQQSSKTTPW